MCATTHFGLLRHGQTTWNLEHRIQGRLDSPLTPAGIETTRQWGRFLNSSGQDWNRIVTSPAPRARHTADIINQQLALEIEVVDDLREQDWGSWEGMTWAEITENSGDYLQQLLDSGWSFRPPEGESRAEVRDRARSVIASCAVKFSGEQILVITHQGVIKSLIYALENRHFLPEEPPLIKKNLLQTISWCNQVMTATRYNIRPSAKP